MDNIFEDVNVSATSVNAIGDASHLPEPTNTPTEVSCHGSAIITSRIL